MKHNIFIDMLESLPPSKYEIVPDNQEDTEVARQLTQMVNYMKDQEREKFIEKYKR